MSASHPTTGPIEVDPSVLIDTNEDYATSGYDTSTTSLTSSINEYVFENGRRYHIYFGADKNLMPTDAMEQDRLDLHHECMSMLLGGELHLAPVSSPHRILDIGTGTGIWAIDMADRYPMAEVTGTDLSPIQPNFVPPNCKFEVDDCELDWTFRDDYFDLIHMRNLAQSIADWSKVLADAYRCTKPGGYLELSDLGGTLHCDDSTMAHDNPLLRDWQLFDKAMNKIGRPAAIITHMTASLRKAGYVDIVSQSFNQPVGPWARDMCLKQVGAMTLLSCETGIEGYAMASFTRILGMTEEEARKVCKDALRAAKNKNTHMYIRFYVVYGRKPC